MRVLARLTEFVQELRRRRVFRVAVVYGAVAFVLVESADLVFPALQLPAWAYTLVVVLAIMGFPVAMVLAWAFDLTPAGVQRTGPLAGPVSGSAHRADGARSPDEADGGPARPPVPSSIAILPFANLSRDSDDDYFSDGVTEDIIARVCSVGDLRVISRTSVMRYKGTDKSLPEIANELRVAYVMEGTVRRTPERVRIVAQLVDAKTDLHVWAETYDRRMEDVFRIQSEVASEVARALKAGLSPRTRERFARAPTGDLDAYDEYLRGRYEWNRRTPRALQRSLEHLDRAVARDPAFTLAHAARADSWLTLAIYGEAAPAEAMDRARQAADAALKLDPDLAEAVTARACIRALYDWDAGGAEADFRRAVELNPQYPMARQWFAMNFLVPRGRFDEARGELEAVGEIDPLSAVLEVSSGVLAFYQRDWSTAVARFEELLERDPDFAVARYFLGLTLTHAGDLDEAERELERVTRVPDPASEALAALAMVHALAGQEEQAARELTLLEGRRAREYVSPVLLAQVLLALGDPDGAMELLEEGLSGRAVDLVWLGVRPAFDPLRGHPDFGARFHTFQRLVLEEGTDSGPLPQPPRSTPVPPQTKGGAG